MEEYDRMTVTRLRALAKEHGLKGYSRMRKAELITFLRENLQAPDPVRKFQTSVERTRVKPLRPKRSKSLELPHKTLSKPMRRSRSLEFQPPPAKPKPRPSKPIRPPPPPPNSFQPYQLEQAFRGALRSFRINGWSKMDVEPSLEKFEGVSPT